SDRSRAAYLAETDDDREWVPNPHQKNHPMPLEMDQQIYDTWADTTGDVRRMLASEEGLSIRELLALLMGTAAVRAPDAYIDVGKMLGEPTDVVIEGNTRPGTPETYEKIFRGLFGNGYQTKMKPSPLVRRLGRMMSEVVHGQDTFERKLRYLLWVN